AGLQTALRILGVDSGEAVIVPTLTFIAAVNPVRYLGAEPVFIDCDDSLCMDPVLLERFCAEECRLEGGVLVNKTSGRVIKAVLPVHIFGGLADMEKIMDTAHRYGLKVLEDATEAMGSFYEHGRYKGKHAGTIGDIGVFSFNANKIITTGGGGMIVSNHAEYLDKAAYLTTTAKDDGLYFVHDEVGYNYRMLNIQAALGVSQIDALEGFIEIKKRNFELYKSLLEGAVSSGSISGIRILPFGEKIRSNHWFYSLLIDDESDSAPGTRRDNLLKKLIAEGIQCRPVWKLVHTQKPYITCRAYEIERAHSYEKHILNVPCSTNLTEDDVRYVCEKIIKACQ
ncbi:MAG: DegT/DnrJ/EryC1/StrS family aminotransferase, partial [Clostridiales Family XIII bacterium]|nr:DegT/DnrJ/EryC1/StrS family aminotransferase [Clostridiales Family XIII bacterium]